MNFLIFYHLICPPAEINVRFYLDPLGCPSDIKTCQELFGSFLGVLKTCQEFSGSFLDVTGRDVLPNY